MRLVTLLVWIEEYDIDPVIPASSSYTKKVKHRLNSFNTRDYPILYYTILYSQLFLLDAGQ